MATVTISITAGANTAGRTKTITAPHLLRFLAAQRKILGLPSATDDEVVQAWADRILAETKNAIRSVEGTDAAKAAWAQQVEIDIT